MVENVAAVQDESASDGESKALLISCSFPIADVNVTEHLLREQTGVQLPNVPETATRKVRLWTEDAKPDEVLR